MTNVRSSRTSIAAILAGLLLSGCVSSGVPKNVAQQIPDGATYLMLVTDSMSADEYYVEIYRALAREGYSFQEENREMGTFKTGTKDVGQGTFLQITTFVESGDLGVVATMRGRASADGETAAMAAAVAGTNVDLSGVTWPAKWGESGRPVRAFGAMILVAKQVPDTRISYRMD